MFHAYDSSKSSLLGAAKVLHHPGYDLLMIDFRGSGGSSGNVTSIGCLEANDVAACVQYAREHLMSSPQPLVLFGQSMGAAAIVRAVGDLGVAPDAIILESPYDRLFSTVTHRFSAMHLPSFPLAHLLMFWAGVQQGYWAFDMNPADSASRVRCPALMFHGALDARVTTTEAKNVFDHLAGPKQFELFENGAHAAFLLADKQRWARCVEVFLNRYAPAKQPQ